ncbi:hypothetical protein C8Q78DRAFT_976965, partial [Trametes maxima]
GVAAFFGGESAASAMATVHFYPRRRWLGWYNQPGGFEIAKRYGRLAHSWLWDALWPGPDLEPAVLFGFNGTSQGPKYTSIQSGTILMTGHIGQLFMDECKAASPHQSPKGNWRVTTPGSVTIAELNHAPNCSVSPQPRYEMYDSLLAAIPIGTSLAACVACAALKDWPCLSMILLGMAISGISYIVIGSGTLSFQRPEPEHDSPPGIGILENGGNELVILTGPKSALNAITRGHFVLSYTNHPENHDIGVCSLLLSAQFFAQLLVIPKGQVPGQFLFLATLAISWAYNSYLSSIDPEGLQRAFLLNQVLHIHRPATSLAKYKLGTRTAMVVFALLVLALAHNDQDSAALRQVFDNLLPNNTEDVWKTWKEDVLENIKKGLVGHGPLANDFHFHFDRPVDGKRSLLWSLYEAAHAAAEMYRELRRCALLNFRVVYWPYTVRWSTVAVLHSMDFPTYLPYLVFSASLL